MSAKKLRYCLLSAFSFLFLIGPLSAQPLPLRDIGRFDGWRSNELVGYGLVVGLAGSGDSQRSVATRQALKNMLGRFGANVSEADLISRNAAIVMVTAQLPPSANIGDRIPVRVSSMGDARSLSGGVLMLTDMRGPDGKTYALSQGALVTGGYSFESQLNLRQRNYPTTAVIEGGATVERSVEADILDVDNALRFFLNEPGYGNADRVVIAINEAFGKQISYASAADEIYIQYAPSFGSLSSFIAKLESLSIQPVRLARIVVNERSGTVVAGGDVRISSVVIAQGDVRVKVEAESFASQPSFISDGKTGISSLVVTNTDLTVDEFSTDIVASFPDASVADLVQGLKAAGVDSRGLISVLQAMKAAGALHAEIIVQ